MKNFIKTEVTVINKMFQANNVMAKVSKADNVLNSFVRYRLMLHQTQSFSDVEKLIREITNAVNKNRKRRNVAPTDIVIADNPTFSLEVNHPNPKPLIMMNEQIDKHEMICGLSAIDNKPEVIKFEDTPHTLIAGMTNSGKSVLLQMMLLSLTANTSPDELKLVLIDLKNEDLVPFRNLPHVIEFAGTREKAIEAIDWVVEEKNRRIEESDTPYRIVLIIDELAQLANEKSIRDKLGDLASIGRSKKINLIAATQNVTKDGGIGSMMKANFTCRLVGKVAPGMSQVATSLPKMYAHLLPGKGSFLRIEGNNNHRFQSFYLTSKDVKKYVANIASKYPKTDNHQPVMSPVITSYPTDNHRFYTSREGTDAITGDDNQFPIGALRDLTSDEIEQVKQLATLAEFQYRGQPSINKLVNHVYGSKCPERIANIKSALTENKLKEVA